jgi:hypothetical protein
MEKDKNKEYARVAVIVRGTRERKPEREIYSLALALIERSQWKW